MFFGNPDPKKIQKMMKKMGIESKELEAEKVIIKTKSKDIVIKNPSITVVKAMGRDNYQISGDVAEQEKISENDIKMVMDQTGKDRETVEKKLKETKDIAKAIMELKD